MDINTLRVFAYMKCMGIKELKIDTDDGEETILLATNSLSHRLGSNKAKVLRYALRYIEATVTAKLGYYIWERFKTYVNAHPENDIKRLKEGDLLFSTELS